MFLLYYWKCFFLAPYSKTLGAITSKINTNLPFVWNLLIFFVYEIQITTIQVTAQKNNRLWMTTAPYHNWAGNLFMDNKNDLHTAA